MDVVNHNRDKQFQICCNNKFIVHFYMWENVLYAINRYQPVTMFNCMSECQILLNYIQPEI